METTPLVREALKKARQNDPEAIHFLHIRFFEDFLDYIAERVEAEELNKPRDHDLDAGIDRARAEGI